MNSSVLAYDDYRVVLKQAQSRYGKRGKPISINLWAKRLGYRSAQALGMVISARRPPSQLMIQRLAGDLGWGPAEVRYFELLVARKRLQLRPNRERDLRQVEDEITFLKKQPKEYLDIGFDVFTYLRDWHCYAIHQLMQAPNFSDSPEWIRKRLRNKVSTKEIRSCLELLIRLGLAKRDSLSDKGKGSISIVKGASLKSPTDIPSRALQAHAIQMMQRAQEALAEQAVIEREITSLTFRGRKQDIQKMKEKVRKFLQELDQEFESVDAPEVFQLNVQLFRHTD